MMDSAWYASERWRNKRCNVPMVNTGCIYARALHILQGLHQTLHCLLEHSTTALIAGTPLFAARAITHHLTCSPFVTIVFSPHDQ
jgi:hypothetical protein